MREARQSGQTPNAGLYQSRQCAHRGAPMGPNNGRDEVGGERAYIDTMPETLIGAVAPAGPV
jgi:hypothetical protein